MHVGRLFYCTYSKNDTVTLRKKTKKKQQLFTDLPTLFQNEAEIRHKYIFLKANWYRQKGIHVPKKYFNFMYMFQMLRWPVQITRELMR